MSGKIAEALVPEWIKEIGEERTRKAAEAEENYRYEALAESLAKSDGPALVRGIIKELTLQALACETIGVCATLNDISRKSEDPTAPIEQRFRLEVSARSPWPKTTYVDIYHYSGDRFVKFYPRDSEAFKLELVPDKRGKLVILSKEGRIISPEQAAASILKPYVKELFAR